MQITSLETPEMQEREFLNLFSLDSSTIDLRERIALEMIKRADILQKYELGLVAPGTVLDFFHEFKPDRRDFYSCHVIKPQEFPEVIRAHGKAAIQKSLRLPEDSELAKEIEQKKRVLEAYLTKLPVQMRLYPNTWKKEIRSLALELYGRSECALVDLCKHSFTLKDSKYLKQAYNIYVENGEDNAAEYLIRLRFRLNKVANILDLFRKKHEEFTGEARKINTSHLERQVEEFLRQTHVPFRRQFPYREITRESSMRKCFADFLVGNTIIEVTDDQDDFIHTPAYFAKLEDKTLVTAEAQKNFLIISSSDKDSYGKLKDVVSSAVSPSETYDFQDIQEHSGELVSVLTEQVPRTRKHPTINPHFASNLYMIGYLRAKVCNN